jgi:signal peptidase
MKTIFNGLYYLFTACIVGIALLLILSMVPVPGNIKVKIVKSGSMEPTIKTGGLVIVMPSSSYEVGDIITFGKDTKTQIPTTHRIIEKEGQGSLEVFKTKGDANDSEDPAPARVGDVQGKVIFTLPYLGYILDFAKKPLGFALLVGIPALLIIFDEIAKILNEVKNLKRKKILDEREEINN